MISILDTVNNEDDDEEESQEAALFVQYLAWACNLPRRSMVSYGSEPARALPKESGSHPKSASTSTTVLNCNRVVWRIPIASL